MVFFKMLPTTIIFICPISCSFYFNFDLSHIEQHYLVSSLANPIMQPRYQVLSFKTTIVHLAFTKSRHAVLLRFRYCRLKRQLFIRHLPKFSQAALLRFKFCRLKRQLFIRYNPKCDVILENSMIQYVRSNSMTHFG